MTQIAPLPRAALLCRCPRCGEGKLYRGLLSLRDSCASCGLDLRAVDVGDGPVVPATMVLGGIVVGLAMWLEFTRNPPLWVHLLLWPLVTAPLAILLIRTLKAGLVWSQYRHRATEMGL